MNIQSELLDLEEQFWRGDAEFFRQNLTNDSLMLLPEPVGILSKNASIDSIESLPRWEDVRFRDVRVIRLTDDSAVLTYRATAKRSSDQTPYSALVGSAYAQRNGSWKLAFHQQTPNGAPASK